MRHHQRQRCGEQRRLLNGRLLARLLPPVAPIASRAQLIGRADANDGREGELADERRLSVLQRLRRIVRERRYREGLQPLPPLGHLERYLDDDAVLGRAHGHGALVARLLAVVDLLLVLRDADQLVRERGEDFCERRLLHQLHAHPRRHGGDVRHELGQIEAAGAVRIVARKLVLDELVDEGAAGVDVGAVEVVHHRAQLRLIDSARAVGVVTEEHVLCDVVHREGGLRVLALLVHVQHPRLHAPLVVDELHHLALRVHVDRVAEAIHPQDLRLLFEVQPLLDALRQLVERHAVFGLEQERSLAARAADRLTCRVQYDLQRDDHVEALEPARLDSRVVLLLFLARSERHRLVHDLGDAARVHFALVLLGLTLLRLDSLRFLDLPLHHI
mmetsp:Transcript_16923/g.50764  ORF Transcript_16923/g.50764 Transcript_16923/m.50764 type:complete len:388 (+) Transcript_16923:734-1897(+)